jgi:hypothetical protein
MTVPDPAQRRHHIRAQLGGLVEQRGGQIAPHAHLGKPGQAPQSLLDGEHVINKKLHVIGWR